jgi:transcriptional regulator with XRE-family HTH domain
LTTARKRYKIPYMKHESRTQQQAFRMEREKRNWSTNDVAKILGVSRQAVNIYEQEGRTTISNTSQLFSRLCELYELNPVEVGKMIAKQREAERKAK